ncbi:MAG: PEGA domain-containing protein [Proteobacteria bacterium]|nr:PEGA domain-containing protein [Pseudomonadota bacterium]
MAHRMKTLMTLFLIGIYLFTVGCATVMNGTSQDIGIASSPAGSEAYINPGNVKVITPGTVTLKRKNSYSIAFKKEGYEDGSATISSSASGWMWGNIVLGGLIGLAIDLISGGGYKLEPNNVLVQLQNKFIQPEVVPQQLSTPESQPKEQEKKIETLENELKKIEKMKSDGLINEEEYLKLKEKIINQY